MRQLFHLVTKEALVLTRDWHALLLLFAMPVMFILVMSLALRDRFAAHGGAALTYYLLNQDVHKVSDEIEAKIRDEKSFRALEGDAVESELAAKVARDEAHFLIVIPAGFGAEVGKSEALAVRLSAAPGVEPAALKLFEAAVRGIVTRVYTEQAIEAMKRGLPPPPQGAPQAPSVDLNAAEKLVRLSAADSRGGGAQTPTAVQPEICVVCAARAAAWIAGDGCLLKCPDRNSRTLRARSVPSLSRAASTASAAIRGSAPSWRWPRSPRTRPVAGITRTPSPCIRTGRRSGTCRTAACAPGKCNGRAGSTSGARAA